MDYSWQHECVRSDCHTGRWNVHGLAHLRFTGAGRLPGLQRAVGSPDVRHLATLGGLATRGDKKRSCLLALCYGRSCSPARGSVEGVAWRAGRVYVGTLYEAVGFVLFLLSCVGSGFAGVCRMPGTI